MLRTILISDPSKPGSIPTTAVAANDAAEAEVRKNVAAQNLLAGNAMQIKPDGQFWSFVDIVSRR